jgi:hypothetical protein
VLTNGSEALKAALVGALPDHVRARVSRLPVEVGDLIEAPIAEAMRWLTDELDALLSLPFGEQPRGPLETFQAAMSFPTAFLLDQGCRPVPRDPVAVNALPGDVFDLAPASSAVLGEDVWRAHLQWGAEKAASLRGRIG